MEPPSKAGTLTGCGTVGDATLPRSSVRWAPARVFYTNYASGLPTTPAGHGKVRKHERHVRSAGKEERVLVSKTGNSQCLQESYFNTCPFFKLRRAASKHASKPPTAVHSCNATVVASNFTFFLDTKLWEVTTESHTSSTRMVDPSKLVHSANPANVFVQVSGRGAEGVVKTTLREFQSIVGLVWRRNGIPKIKGHATSSTVNDRQCAAVPKLTETCRYSLLYKWLESAS